MIRWCEAKFREMHFTYPYYLVNGADKIKYGENYQFGYLLEYIPKILSLLSKIISLMFVPFWY